MQLGFWSRLVIVMTSLKRARSICIPGRRCERRAGLDQCHGMPVARIRNDARSRRHAARSCANRGPNLPALIHSALVLRTGSGAGASRCLVFRTKTGGEVGLSKRSGSSSIKLPTLRFRAKIMLGFAVVLAISAASMGFAYLGFERVSAGVDVLPAQRAGGRSGAQHRPRTDLLPLAGPLFRGDRQGRGRQGGAGGRGRPEGRHHRPR